MNFREKKLYHQIHPLKLLVDVSMGLFCTLLIWRHNFFWFLLLSVFPSIVISLVLIRYAGLEWLKASGFGNYLRKYMSVSMELTRLTGQILIWVAAWYHQTVLMISGFLLILLAWSRGLIFPLKQSG